MQIVTWFREHGVLVHKSILLYEGDVDLAATLRFHFERDGYRCRVVATVSRLLLEVTSDPPTVVVVDHADPQVGHLIIGELRHMKPAGIPRVVAVIPGNEENEVVAALAAGFDDVVVRPISVKLLLARVAALFRRLQRPPGRSTTWSAGPITLDSERYEIHINQQAIPLSLREFRIMQALIRADGQVLSRGDLIERSVGRGTGVADRSVDTHIIRLRKKLGDAAGLLKTIRGVGYAFRPGSALVGLPGFVCQGGAPRDRAPASPAPPGGQQECLT